MPTLLLLLVRPCRAAARIHDRPRWLGTFLLLAAALVLLRIAMHPHLVAETMAHLPPTTTQEDRTWAGEVMDSELPLRCALLPVRFLVGAGSFAFLLFFLCGAFMPPRRVPFRHVLAIEMHAEIVNVAGSCAALAFALAGSDATLLSLAAVVEPGSNVGLRALLTSVNIFTLWYVATLTAGVTVLFGYPKLRAFLLAVTAWIVSVAINASLLESVSTYMHLRV